MGVNGELIPPKDKNELISQFENDISGILGDYKCEKIIADEKEFTKTEIKLFSMLNNVTGYLVSFVEKQREREAQLEESVKKGGLPRGEGGSLKVIGGGVPGIGGNCERGMRGGGVGESYDDTVDHQGTNPWILKENPNLLNQLNQLRARMKFVESDQDDCSQRLWKGVFKLKSPKFKRGNGGKVNIDSLFVDMPAPKEGEEEDASVTKETLEKMLELVKQKYNVDIPVKEVTAAHWLPGGDFLISLQYRNPVLSVFGSLVKAIKSGGDTGMNFYVNFSLTNKRQHLFAYVRDLKFRQKIEQYSVNENGRISIRIRGRWMRVTQHFNDAGKVVPTYSTYDLDKEILNN